MKKMNNEEHIAHMQDIAKNVLLRLDNVLEEIPIDLYYYTNDDTSLILYDLIDALQQVAVDVEASQESVRWALDDLDKSQEGNDG